MIEGIRNMTVADQTYGELKLAVAVPYHGDSWGVLAPLRETVWGPLIRVVPGEAIAHARHGYAEPLIRVLGPAPSVLARKIVDHDGLCDMAQKKSCGIAGQHCRPGSKLPECYQPPTLTGSAQEMAAVVALAWRDGFYVLVVDGNEFSLT